MWLKQLKITWKLKTHTHTHSNNNNITFGKILLHFTHQKKKNSNPIHNLIHTHTHIYIYHHS